MNIKKMLADGMAHYLVRRESTAPLPRQADERVWPAKRKPKGYRQARKKRQKQARAARRGKRG